MFTRIVEMTSKSGKSKELADTIDEKAVPILKKQRMKAIKNFKIKMEKRRVDHFKAKGSNLNEH